MDDFIIKLDEIMTKKPRDYGCGIEIYPSDIHMIEVIGNYKDVNTTQIAHILGITKGNVSKLTKNGYNL